MPLFVLLVLMITGAPSKIASPSQAEQIERNREELQALREKHGNDAEERFREHLSAL